MSGLAGPAYCQDVGGSRGASNMKIIELYILFRSFSFYCFEVFWNRKPGQIGESVTCGLLHGHGHDTTRSGDF